MDNFIKQQLNPNPNTPWTGPRNAALKILHNIRTPLEIEKIKCPNGHGPSFLVGKIFLEKRVVPIKIYFCNECSELFDKKGFIIDIWEYTEKVGKREPFVFR